MCAWRSSSPACGEKPISSLPSRNACIFAIVRSRDSSMLITILKMINPILQNQKLFLQAHFCMETRRLFRLMPRWTRLSVDEDSRLSYNERTRPSYPPETPACEHRSPAPSPPGRPHQAKAVSRHVRADRGSCDPCQPTRQALPEQFLSTLAMRARHRQMPWRLWDCGWWRARLPIAERVH